jgi:Ca-activated chloride channel homolog
MRRTVILVLSLLALSSLTPCFADALMVASDNIGYLPLVSTRVSVEINDQVATTTIDHSFYLDHASLPDLTYYFPLPSGASVTGLGMWFDDELHYYDLEPGEQSGVGGDGIPYHLEEYLGDNPFRQTFPEMGAGEVTVRLEYTELMNYDFGDYTLTFPLDHPTFYTCEVDSFFFEVHGQSQRLIEGVLVSPFNAEFTSLTDYEFEFFVWGEGTPTANLNTVITVSQEDVGLWLMSYRPVDVLDPGHYLAILEPGDVAPGEIIQKNFTFVIDKSGSMGTEPMQEAREAAIYCVSHLDESDYFNVIAFDYTPFSWRENPVVASPQNVYSATNFINSLSASGGTNFNDAVIQALQQEAVPYRANQILVLSDGQPTVGVTDLPDILDNIEQENDIGASIFTVAAGDHASLDFLDFVALENAGLSHTVVDLANLAEEIELFFMRFSSPVLTQVSLDYGTVETDESYPPAPYTIFAGSQTIISGLYTSPNETMIELSATFAGVDTTLTYGPFNFTQGDTTSFSFVPRMWAIQKIDYWLAYMAVYGEDQEIIDMIVELSLQYGILTEYTGYNTPVEELFSLIVLADRDKQAVYLTWNLTPHVDATFDVYRKEVGGRAYLKLNREPIDGSRFADRTAQSNISYVYRVMVVEGDVAVAPGEVRVAASSRDLIAALIASPNPFNANSRISFTLARSSELQLAVYDVLGREVAILMDGKTNPGNHVVTFNGDKLASGTYFLRISARDQDSGEVTTRTSRMMLMK